MTGPGVEDEDNRFLGICAMCRCEEFLEEAPRYLDMWRAKYVCEKCYGEIVAAVRGIDKPLS